MPTYELRARSVVELLDASFLVLRDLLVAGLALYVAPAALIGALADAIYRRADDYAGQTEATLLFLLGTLLATAGFAVAGYAFNHYLAARLVARPAALAGSARAALARAVPVAWTEVLVVLLVLGGFVLLVLPGIWVLLASFVVLPVMVVEGTFGPAAFQRSRALMAGRKRRVVAALLIWIALDVLFDLGLEALLGGDGPLQDLLYGLSSGFLDLFVLVFSYLLYLDQRCRKEAYEIEHLAQQVEAAPS